MRIGYTEFSFGYAFTENLIRSIGTKPKGAPVFPNLIQEAQLGYDVHIDLPGCPLFFQYKLPELMVKKSAAEIAKHHLPGMQVRFFRMALMRRDLSQQHQLLMNLERRFPNRVFYSTPCIENVRDFNSAYNAAQVHRRSVFFSPRDIGLLPDNKAHSVAYRGNLRSGYLCSEPRKVSAKTFEDIEKTILKSFHQVRFRTLGRASEELRKEVLQLLPPQMRQSEGLVRERIRSRRAGFEDRPALSPQAEEVVNEILVSRELVRVGLGLDLLIAQPYTGADSVQEA